MLGRSSPWEIGKPVEGTPYRVLSLIGSGGMGCVYDVEHIELGRKFVAKALHPHLLRRDDLVARMRNEWRALGALNHPNIVPVTDAGSTANGIPFFIMEKLDGQTFYDLCKGKEDLSRVVVVSALADILCGLHAAHCMGMVHRDIKPQNLLLTTTGRPYILDFGIAQLRERYAKVVTENGIAIGTPRFMAPEQAEGRKVDARADIYAIALVLFEMLAGKGPFFHIKDPNQLVLAQINEPPPRLDYVINDCPPELADLIQRWLSKSPSNRPPDAQQAAEELQSLLPLLQSPELNDEQDTAIGRYNDLTLGAATHDVRQVSEGPLKSSDLPMVTDKMAEVTDHKLELTLSLHEKQADEPSFKQAPGLERSDNQVPTWLKLRTNWVRPVARPGNLASRSIKLENQQKYGPLNRNQVLIGLLFACISFGIASQLKYLDNPSKGASEEPKDASAADADYCNESAVQQEETDSSDKISLPQKTKSPSTSEQTPKTYVQNVPSQAEEVEPELNPLTRKSPPQTNSKPDGFTSRSRQTKIKSTRRFTKKSVPSKRRPIPKPLQALPSSGL